MNLLSFLILSCVNGSIHNTIPKVDVVVVEMSCCPYAIDYNKEVLLPITRTSIANISDIRIYFDLWQNSYEKLGYESYCSDTRFLITETTILCGIRYIPRYVWIDWIVCMSNQSNYPNPNNAWSCAVKTNVSMDDIMAIKNCLGNPNSGTFGDGAKSLLDTNIHVVNKTCSNNITEPFPIHLCNSPSVFVDGKPMYDTDYNGTVNAVCRSYEKQGGSPPVECNTTK